MKLNKKTILLISIVLLIAPLKAQFIKKTPYVIKHKDPYDIKNTNLYVGGAYTFTKGAHIFLIVNHYLKPKIMAYYSGYYFPWGWRDDNSSVIEKRYIYGSEGNNLYSFNSLGCDFHIFDDVIDKDIQVNLKVTKIGINSEEIIYTMVPSQKRRVIALNMGFMTISGNERFYKKQSGSGPYFLLNEKSNLKQSITNDTMKSFGLEVWANTSMINMLFGLKFKNIIATQINHNKYGIKTRSPYKELYFDFIVPLLSSHDDVVYKNGNKQTPYRIINTSKPKLGFKSGLNFRNSLKSKISLGAEIGYIPSVALGSYYFYTLRFGYNLNFGKINYLN